MMQKLSADALVTAVIAIAKTTKSLFYCFLDRVPYKLMSSNVAGQIGDSLRVDTGILSGSGIDAICVNGDRSAHYIVSVSSTSYADWDKYMGDTFKSADGKVTVSKYNGLQIKGGTDKGYALLVFPRSSWGA